jgi:hypothetical protein
MTAFARPLDLEVHGPQLRAPKQPRARRAAAPVRLGIVEEGRAVQVQPHFVSAPTRDPTAPEAPSSRPGGTPDSLTTLLLVCEA